MIPADKSRWIACWLARDAESRIKKTFGTVRARGLDALRGEVARGPVLVVSNHTAWWDPVVLQYLCVRVLRADAYALMDAKNLARLPFFRKVGAFGVDLESPEDGVRAMRYAAKLLDAPGRIVWIFPQGKEVPITVRPLGFRAGSAEIARIAKKARVVPVAIRYEHGAEPQPDMWLSFGEPLAPETDRQRGRVAQEQAVADELDRIERALAGDGSDAFEHLCRRPPDRFFALAQALLSWLTRPREIG
ncbi:MAG: lysophospholipid acyltransferase family protein [Myxococcales bacterium]|nr:lysophospholipid acyltransferase family protein [Myxococcales bacterium]